MDISDHAIRRKGMTQRLLSGSRRFLWVAAGADIDLLNSANMPRSEGIRYSAIGAAIVMTTLTATVAWGHNFMVTFSDTPQGVLLAIAGAIGMGALLGIIERLLIVSIPATITTRGKWAAFAWRTLLALLNATILAIPFGLSYFGQDILGRLDDDKLSHMESKREKVDTLFALTPTVALAANLEAALDKKRAERYSLPLDVQELESQISSCDAEYRKLKALTEPKMRASKSAQGELQREIVKSTSAEFSVRSQIDHLTRQIAAWARGLDAKAQTCDSLRAHVAAAKYKYYSDWKVAYEALSARTQDAEATMADAQRQAKSILAQSDAAVEIQSMPKLGAQVRALVDLIEEDREVKVVVAVIFAFFAMIDLMPIVAKLTNRASYEHAVAARERIMRAQTEGAATVREAKAAVKVEIAMAELAGFRRFCAEAEGSVFAERARILATLEVHKAEVLAPFEYVDALCQAAEDAHRRIDELAAEIHGNVEAQRDMDDIGQLLRGAMERASRELNRHIQNPMRASP